MREEGKNLKNKIADSHRFANHKKENARKVSYILQNAQANKTFQVTP